MSQTIASLAPLNSKDKRGCRFDSPALQFKRFRFGPLFNPQWNEPRDGRNVP